MGTTQQQEELHRTIRSIADAPARRNRGMGVQGIRPWDVILPIHFREPNGKHQYLAKGGGHRRFRLCPDENEEAEATRL